MLTNICLESFEDLTTFSFTLFWNPFPLFPCWSFTYFWAVSWKNESENGYSTIIFYLLLPSKVHQNGARIQFLWRGNLWKNRGKKRFSKRIKKRIQNHTVLLKKPYIRSINTHLSNLWLAVKSRCLFLKWTPRVHSPYSDRESALKVHPPI